MKLLSTVIAVVLILQACETPPPAQGPNAQNSNGISNDDQGVIVIEIPTDLKTQSTNWIFSATKDVKIPDLPIDSIIFQAHLRSVNDEPGAEAILFNADENRFINSSILYSNVSYTIVSYRSANLKGYFNPKEYTLKVGLRTQDERNPVSLPHECKLIIYHQL